MGDPISADIDGDGDIDIVSTYTYGQVVWYENKDGKGKSWAENNVTKIIGGNQHIVIFAADIDGDDDIDLAIATDKSTSWYENVDGKGAVWAQMNVSAFGGSSMHAADIDGDGDVDLAIGTNNKVLWHENINGKGSFGKGRVVSNKGSSNVIIVDLNGDGDADIMSDSSWYENTDGNGTFGTEQIISASGRTSVFAADLDGDNDIDFACTKGQNNIGWYENTDGKGTFGPLSLLTTSNSEVGMSIKNVIAADFDGDGDMDLAIGTSTMKIIWYELPIVILNDLKFGTPQQIESSSVGYGLFATDIEGDGNPDLAVGSTYWAGDWTFHGGANGKMRVFSFPGFHSFERNGMIERNGGWVDVETTCVHGADFDGDGDIDLVFGLSQDVIWYKFDDDGIFKPQYINQPNIKQPVGSVQGVFAADIDGDGDMDFVSISATSSNPIAPFKNLVSGETAWYENTDGKGTFAIRHTVSDIPGVSVFAADLDGDKDVDLVVGTDTEVLWYENTDGNGTFDSKTNVSIFAEGGRSIFAADIDGDGDIDLASAYPYSNNIAWYENKDGKGTFGTQRIVSTSVEKPQSVYVADLDGDGDMDIASASEQDHKIAWYENVDGKGTFGAQVILSDTSQYASYVVAADFNGDGAMDLASSTAPLEQFAGSSGYDPSYTWYQNRIAVIPLGRTNNLETEMKNSIDRLRFYVKADRSFVVSGLAVVMKNQKVVFRTRTAYMAHRSALVYSHYNDMLKWQFGRDYIYSTLSGEYICDSSNVYLPLVFRNTRIENVHGYDVLWGENKQPVVAKVNGSELAKIVQNRDLLSREPFSDPNACSKLFPNCCKKSELGDLSKTQIYAGIQYTNTYLNISTEIPTDILAIDGTDTSICPPGTSWQYDLDTIKCMPIACPAGQEAQGYSCTNCATGKFKAVPGILMCGPCPRNTFVSTNGSTAYTECPENSKATDEGSTSIGDCICDQGRVRVDDTCVVCDLGTAMVADTSGHLYCEPCAAGTYQNVKGQPRCLPCPVDTYNEATGSTAPAQCTKCTEFALSTTTNGTTGVANATGCMCRQTYYHHTDPTGKEDYCKPCPEGGLCPRVNTLLGTIISQKGYWRSAQDSPTFYSCPVPDACAGTAIATTSDDQCTKGNAGVVCALCAENYVQMGGVCAPCEDGTGTSGTGWMIFIACIMYSGVLSYLLNRAKAPPPPKATIRIGTALTVLSAIAKMRRKSREKLDVEGVVEEASGASEGSDGGFKIGPYSKFSGRLRIFFGFMQINAALGFAVDVPWPK
eukprot:g2001.t1